MERKYEIEKRERTSKGFPKNLEERANSILASVNTEYKSASLGFFLDDKLKTKDDIRNTAEGYVDPTVNRVPSKETFRKHCTGTFIPIGMVAEERIKYKGRTNPVSYYKLTEDGEKYGKPIAQLSLKTAVDNNLSMYEIFGPTASPGKTRSPLNTAKILFELEKEENLRKVDLENRTGLYSSSIKRHLDNLKELGFVDYDSVSLEESGWSKYEWIKEKNPENVKPIHGYTTLTREVANKMKKIGVSDSNELTKILDYKNSGNLSKILSDLEKQGFVKRTKKFKGGEKLSEASITEEAKNFLEEFLEPVYGALEGDFKAVYDRIELFDDISNISDYISKGFNLYEKVCPAYKRENKEDTKFRILQLLENNPGLRVKEIDDMLGKSAGECLKELVESGEIEKEREGKAVFYSLNN